MPCIFILKTFCSILKIGELVISFFDVTNICGQCHANLLMDNVFLYFDSVGDIWWGYNDSGIVLVFQSFWPFIYYVNTFSDIFEPLFPFLSIRVVLKVSKYSNFLTHTYKCNAIICNKTFSLKVGKY